MKNLKSKIRDFLDSEEGRVGVKTPLALGVAAGGLMLAQAMVVIPDAAAQGCTVNADCPGAQECVERCVPNHGVNTAGKNVNKLLMNLLEI
ncbi:MAG: hypothetical protein OXN25_22380 [Candidatus Poribacteria bacterium]|nr:hypothetical protein [Candidatus Poribacteria bacterium]